MSMLILDDCISCGACEPECPNTAISAGDSIFVINTELCTECEGAFDSPQCATVCPVEGCVVKNPT
jgi:ferredoxin